MITPHQMLARQKERPFRPFQVVTKSGEAFEVRAWDHYLVLRDEVLLPVGARRPADLPQRIIPRRYEDIERVEPLDRAAP